MKTVIFVVISFIVTVLAFIKIKNSQEDTCIP